MIDFDKELDTQTTKTGVGSVKIVKKDAKGAETEVLKAEELVAIKPITPVEDVAEEKPAVKKTRKPRATKAQKEAAAAEEVKPVQTLEDAFDAVEQEGFKKIEAANNATEHLNATEANKEHLVQSIAELDAGETKQHDLVEDLFTDCDAVAPVDEVAEAREAQLEGTVKVSVAELKETTKRKKNVPGVVCSAPLMATIGITGGRVINLGNYESARLEVSIQMPTPVDEIDDTYAFCKDWIDTKIDEALGGGEVVKVGQGKKPAVAQTLKSAVPNDTPTKVHADEPDPRIQQEVKNTQPAVTKVADLDFDESEEDL